jgi:hypothetical protein
LRRIADEDQTTGEYACVEMKHLWKFALALKKY